MVTGVRCFSLHNLVCFQMMSSEKRAPGWLICVGDDTLTPIWPGNFQPYGRPGRPQKRPDLLAAASAVAAAREAEIDGYAAT